MSLTLRTRLQQAVGPTHTIERQLDTGGMTAAYVARVGATNLLVVLKVLESRLADEVSPSRFVEELRSAAHLQHPNIIPLLAADEADGIAYYTTPFVEGETLRERMREIGPMPLAQITSIVADVCAALAVAHESGIIHYDIRPENILLGFENALVADFGVASAVQASRKHGPLDSFTQVGTPAYMAPEQAMGNPSVDGRVDIYSLGVVAYEMLMGELPFIAATAQGMVGAHLTHTVPAIATRRPDAPRALASLVMQCLEKDPAQRPRNVNEILEQLDAVDTAVRPVTGAIVRHKPGGGTLAVIVAGGMLVAWAASC